MTWEGLHAKIHEMAAAGVPLRAALKDFRRAYVKAAVQITGGKRNAAARLIEVHRNSITRVDPGKKLPQMQRWPGRKGRLRAS